VWPQWHALCAPSWPNAYLSLVGGAPFPPVWSTVGVFTCVLGGVSCVSFSFHPVLFFHCCAIFAVPTCFLGCCGHGGVLVGSGLWRCEVPRPTLVRMRAVCSVCTRSFFLAVRSETLFWFPSDSCCCCLQSRFWGAVDTVALAVCSSFSCVCMYIWCICVVLAFSIVLLFVPNSHSLSAHSIPFFSSSEILFLLGGGLHSFTLIQACASAGFVLLVKSTSLGI
jgi:hypothetical protein